MVLSLIKGQKIDLTKNNPDTQLLSVGLNWQAPGNLDIDVSAFMVGQDEKIVSEEDFVFYGQPSSSNGSVVIEESITTNEKQNFLVDLLHVPEEVQKIIFTLSIYESDFNGHTFEEVSAIQLRILNKQTLEEVAAFPIQYSFTKESAIVLGAIYRYSGEWKFQAIGAGFFGGLADLCKNYGVEVDDQPTEEALIELETNDTQEPVNQTIEAVQEDDIVEEEIPNPPEEYIPLNEAQQVPISEHTIDPVVDQSSMSKAKIQPIEAQDSSSEHTFEPVMQQDPISVPEIEPEAQPIDHPIYQFEEKQPAAVPVTTVTSENQTMKDYIEIPEIIHDLTEIHSENVSTLTTNSTIMENKISLDYLREVYRTDRTRFINLVDELSLRGFRFITDKPTNILPTFSPQLAPYVEVKEENTRFTQMNFSTLGLGEFINRFHVDNDLFFHKTPLNGFNYMNANMDLNNLAEEFLKAGFGIIHTDAAQEHATEDEVGPKEEETTEVTPGNDFEELRNTTAIVQLFEDNKYKIFRRFCERKQLMFIADITPDVLEKFKRTPGVGIGKVRAVDERLEEFQRLGEHLLPDQSQPLDPEAPAIELTNKYAGDKEISQLFYENGYNKFRNFCEDKGVKIVGQLKQKHIDEFTRSPGIGRKKVQDVLELLVTYAKSAADFIPAKFEAGELFESIKKWHVSSLLKLFGYQTISNSSLKLEDIQGKDFEIFEGEWDVRSLIEFSNKLNSLKHPKTLAEGIPAVIKEQEMAVIQGRFVKKWTLEETGQSLGVTRERVRQIEAKAIQKIFNYLKFNQFRLIVKLLSHAQILIPEDEVLDLIGEENSYLLEVLKDKKSIFAYFDKMGVFCTDPEECQNFNEIVEEYIFDLPEIFNSIEYQSFFEEMLEKVGVKEPSDHMIQKVLESYGFKHYGELYSRRKLHIPDVLENLFRNYIHQPLRIDENSIEQLKKLALEHYHYSLEGSVRSIDARLRDTSNMILVESNTYQWFDSEEFDQTIVSLVDAYLKQRFLEVNVINIDEVYHAFEDQLKHYGITSKLQLYSIIKYFLDDEYSIGKGNTLNFYQKDAEKTDRKETIVEAIRNLGGTCSKDELKELLRVPMYRIDQSISASEKLIPWGTNQIKLFESIGLTNEETDGLISLVNRSLKEGYTTAGILYKELMFDRNLAGLIGKGIDTNAKLAAVIKKLMPTLKGHVNFLYEEGSQITSFDEVILSHFNDGASRKEIHDFAKEHGYSEVMASNLIGSLLEQELLIEVDIDLLYPAREFHIPDEVVQALTTFIEEHRQGKRYISLNQLKGYKRKLPVIAFRWNPFLMRSILVKHGFRQIQKIHRDYRYDKILLVKEDSEIQTFEELVYFVLKEEYEGNMHEVKVYDFLVDKGIVREQDSDYDKSLPSEIKDSGKLISVNTIGIVTLN
ncbi:TerD family protein [Neobacillus sp. K501]